jgi:hypothetical protein
VAALLDYETAGDHDVGNVGGGGGEHDVVDQVFRASAGEAERGQSRAAAGGW